MSPRTKLVALVTLFALPIAASLLAYRFGDAQPNANYGELLLPPAAVSTAPLERVGAGQLALSQLAGKWVIVAFDAASCEAACRGKLERMGQVRLALGRNATRVECVLLIDDGQAPAPQAIPADAAFHALRGAGVTAALGRPADRGHLYLVDPHGNVMMRWPAQADRKRMLKDLERLLKASQIG